MFLSPVGREAGSRGRGQAEHPWHPGRTPGSPGLPPFGRDVTHYHHRHIRRHVPRPVIRENIVPAQLLMTSGSPSGAGIGVIGVEHPARFSPQRSNGSDCFFAISSSITSRSRSTSSLSNAAFITASWRTSTAFPTYREPHGRVEMRPVQGRVRVQRGPDAFHLHIQLPGLALGGRAEDQVLDKMRNPAVIRRSQPLPAFTQTLTATRSTAWFSSTATVRPLGSVDT